MIARMFDYPTGEEAGMPAAHHPGGWSRCHERPTMAAGRSRILGKRA
jgi:hypothetical protein